MTIASLFVSLGFTVKNPTAIADAEKALVSASHSATRAAVAIDSLNAALFLLLETSAKVGVALKEFQIRTGLSTDHLQEWQQQARAANVSAEDLTETIKDLQDQRTAFALNEPNAVGAWSLLGVDPRADPFVVLQRLRERLRSFPDVGLARNLAGRVGIGEGIFQMLRQDPAAVNQNLILNQKQIDILWKLKLAWNGFVQSLEGVKTQLGTAFAPAATKFLEILTKLVNTLTVFTKWLNGTTTGAHYARIALGVLTAGAAVLGTVVTFLAGALGAAASVAGLLTLASSELAAALLPVAVVVGLIAAGLVALVLLLQDLYVASTGGKSFFQWGVGKTVMQGLLKNFQELRDLIKEINGLWDNFLGHTSAAGAAVSVAGAAANPAGFGNFMNGGARDWLLKKLDGQFAPSANVTQNVDITIPDSGDPHATANAVRGQLQTQINKAYRSGVADNW